MMSSRTCACSHGDLALKELLFEAGVQARPREIISCGRHGMISKSTFYISLCFLFAPTKSFVGGGGGLRNFWLVANTKHKL
jgi:hypothetical protein